MGKRGEKKKPTGNATTPDSGTGMAEDYSQLAATQIIKQLTGMFAPFQTGELRYSGPGSSGVNKAVRTLNQQLEAKPVSYPAIARAANAVQNAWEKLDRGKRRVFFKGPHSKGTLILRRFPQLLRRINELSRQGKSVPS